MSNSTNTEISFKDNKIHQHLRKPYYLHSNYDLKFLKNNDSINLFESEDGKDIIEKIISCDSVFIEKNINIFNEITHINYSKE